MLPAPAPGEASIDPNPGAQRLVLIRNVALGTLTREQRLDAMFDTGATYCIVPPSVAHLLGFHSGNRLRSEKLNAVGGQVDVDIHRLEYLRVGTAQARNIMIGVVEVGVGFRFMLLGLSFIRKFKTTVDFDEGRVLFRSRAANR